MMILVPVAVPLTSVGVLLGAPHAPGGNGPPLDLFHSNNEWFWPHDDPLAYGQLCWSNTSLIDFVTERVKVTLRAAPTATIVSVSQNGECSYRPSSLERRPCRLSSCPRSCSVHAIVLLLFVVLLFVVLLLIVLLFFVLLCRASGLRAKEGRWRADNSNYCKDPGDMAMIEEDGSPIGP